MNKAEKIELLALVTLIGFAAAMMFHYVMAVYFHADFPWITFAAFPTRDFVFSDFHSIFADSGRFNPYHAPSTFGGVYFPFNYFLFFFLTLLPENLAFLIYMSAFLVAVLWATHHFMDTRTSFHRDPAANLAHTKNVFILSLLSYPILFAIERANAECIVFVFTLAFLLAYQARRYYLAAFWLACGIAMKGYAGIFLLVFLFDRRFKEGTVACLWIAALTFFSLFLFVDDIPHQIDMLLHNLAALRAIEIQNFDSANFPFNSTLFDFIRVFGLTATPEILSRFTFWGGIAIIGVMVELFLFEKMLWRQMAALVAASLLFVPLSVDYHLLRLLFPLYLFVNEKPAAERRSDIIYTAIFALLLIPKNYFAIATISIAHWMETGLLLLLLILIMADNLSARFKTRTAAQLS